MLGVQRTFLFLSIAAIFWVGCTLPNPNGFQAPYGDRISASSHETSYLIETEKPTSSLPPEILHFGGKKHSSRSIPVIVLCLSDYVEYKNYLNKPPDLKGVRSTQISLSFFDSHKNLLKEEIARTGPDGSLDLFPLLPPTQKTRFVAINSDGALFYFDMIEVIRDQRIFIPCEPFFEKPRSTNP